MNTTNGSVSFQTASDPREGSLEWLWKVHWILFSILFLTVGLYSIAWFYKSTHSSSPLTRNYRLAVLSLLVILSISRTLYLILDPYHLGVGLAHDFPKIISRLIYSLGQPALIAAFGLIHALFLKIVKTRHYRQKPILKTKVILFIVAVYFVFGIFAELLTEFLPNLHAMLAVSRGFSVAGCTVVTVTISYSGLKILRASTKNRRVLSRGTRPSSVDELMKTKSVAKVAKVTLAAATLCSTMTIANSVAFFKMIIPGAEEWIDIWELITFVSCIRVLEIAMACTLLYALARTGNKSWNPSFIRRLTKSFSSSQEGSDVTEKPTKTHVKETTTFKCLKIFAFEAK